MKKYSYYIICFVVISGIVFGFYHQIKLSVWGEKSTAVITKKIFDGYDFQYVFILNGKPYVHSIEDRTISVGDCIGVRYMVGDPEERLMRYVCDENSYIGKVVFFGRHYPQSAFQMIKVYKGESLVKTLSFSESFGLIVDWNQTFKIEYIVNGKVMYTEECGPFYKDKANVKEVDYSEIEDNINKRK